MTTAAIADTAAADKMLAEKRGRIGVMTGGMVGLSCLGGFVVPILFGALMSVTGSYFIGFIVVGVAPLLAGIRLGIVSRAGRAKKGASSSP